MRRALGLIVEIAGWTFGVIGVISIPSIPLVVMGMVMLGALDEMGLTVIALATAPFLLIPLSLTLSFLGREWRRPDEGLCVRCGYDVRGLHGRICPECGTEF